MAPSGTDQFFEQKRPWSLQKDEVLEQYLKRYIPKVAQGVGKPILIVDGFAGPGSFQDGARGSPLIIADTIDDYDFDVQLLAIEENAEYASSLSSHLANRSFARCENGRFEDFLPQIVEVARERSTFLFVDPYALKGLDFEQMDRVFKLIEGNRSIEILLNFNAWAFGRTAMQAQQAANENADGLGVHIESPLLDAVAGGNWWQAIVEQHSDFGGLVDAVTVGFAKRLAGRFRFVAFHKIMESYQHRIPKYFLVYGSRSEKAVMVMNDVMASAKQRFIDQQAPMEGMLFDVRPVEFAPDVSEIDPLLMRCSSNWIQRAQLVREVVWANYGRLTESQIRKRIAALIHDGKLMSESGKNRINDQARICVSPSRNRL